jgi:hypothetical protein
MMRKLFFLLSLILVVSPLMAQQQSRCADCHISAIELPAPYHFNAWERSAHGRNRVGCESCHGGDATTFESFRAHQDILNSRNPASPVHRRNIPQTCGACHTGQFVAFQDSGHYALLQEGDQDTPICTTCHESVGARLLSPKGLAKQCSKCHAEGEIAPRPDYSVQGRQLLEGILEVRALMDEARPLIRRVKDETRRESLQYTYDQAEVPLIEAVLAGHSFVFDRLEERLGVARRRAEALLERLANPPAR